MARNTPQPAAVLSLLVLSIGLFLAAGANDDEAFLHGLRELGYVEGKNMVITYRWAEGKAERPPALAADLVRLKVDVIVTCGDAAGDGLVASFARPGGNITGLSLFTRELSGKRALPLDVRFPDGIEPAFAEAARWGAGAVPIISDSATISHRGQLGAAALNRRLPTTFSNRAYLQGGSLMSYGTNILDSFRRAASYVDRILKGARPAEMPMEQPTRFELVISLRTARALGLAVLQSLLSRADEVIQQISELLAVRGIDFVGPLPPEIQKVTVFSAGIAAGAIEVRMPQKPARRFWDDGPSDRGVYVQGCILGP